MYIKLICDYNKRNRQGTRRLIFNFLRTINPFPWLISLRGRGQGRGYFSVLKWHVSLSRIHCETCRSSVSFRCDTCSMLIPSTRTWSSSRRSRKKFVGTFRRRFDFVRLIFILSHLCAKAGVEPSMARATLPHSFSPFYLMAISLLVCDPVICHCFISRWYQRIGLYHWSAIWFQTLTRLKFEQRRRDLRVGRLDTNRFTITQRMISSNQFN